MQAGSTQVNDSSRRCYRDIYLGGCMIDKARRDNQQQRWSIERERRNCIRKTQALIVKRRGIRERERDSAVEQIGSIEREVNVSNTEYATRLKRTFSRCNYATRERTFEWNTRRVSIVCVCNRAWSGERKERGKNIMGPFVRRWFRCDTIYSSSR